jgi:hypothetical protein
LENNEKIRAIIIAFVSTSALSRRSFFTVILPVIFRLNNNGIITPCFCRSYTLLDADTSLFLTYSVHHNNSVHCLNKHDNISNTQYKFIKLSRVAQTYIPLCGHPCLRARWLMFIMQHDIGFITKQCCEINKRNNDHNRATSIFLDICHLIRCCLAVRN